MRKILVSLFIVWFFFNTPNLVNALSNEQKWVILERFTQKQYDLIFESDLLNFSSEYSDVFSISRQIDIYSAMQTTAERERIEVENKKVELLETITSLEESLALLEKDIGATTEKIKQINQDVITIKNDIDVNTRTIEILKTKIEENTEILLQYLVYIYKKSNTAYSWDEIDNIKSILLNWESIWDLVNDLYFKGIIQVTGKKLIDNHRKYISELYIKKIALERQEQELKMLRKQWILEQKMLQDKRKFQEEIIEASRWKQNFYEIYLDQKLKLENEIKLKAIKEQVRLSSTRNSILSKYNCEYVDVSKNSAEARILQMRNSRCYSINKIILSEDQLTSDDKEKAISNPLTWPVNPIQWITAYFRDKEYEQMFWAEHNAIDIKVPQWTSIEAPMDGYVIYMSKPTSQDYSYIALKHYDWFVTVYWHLSEILVEDFQYVEKWQIFARTGWEYWTYWAWYITTGPHLHFEVFQDKEYIDPLSVLDLSYIRYQVLPEKYSLKYEIDFRNTKWYDYVDASTNSKVFKLEWKDEIERQEYLIRNYAASWFNDWGVWIDESLNWWIDPSFVMCIWLAESWLWNNLTSAYNIWNVWNNDRWDRRDYSNAKEWIRAIVYALNNQYLHRYDTLAYLSWWWRDSAWLPACWATPTEYCYASSMTHWHNNMKRCLSHLKWYYILDSYKFRYN